LRLVDPQINCQNEITKSQILMASDTPSTAVIFAYTAPQEAVAQNADNYVDLLSVTNLLVQGVIKYELSISVAKMDLYVAPTYINLDNPTFWINRENNKEMMDFPQGSTPRSGRRPTNTPTSEELPGDTVLRNIMTLNGYSLTIE